MAYRADFYIKYNIIGFTGSLHNKPTVYFKNAGEFGHITQSHRAAYNVGREEVESELDGFTFIIENEIQDGEEVAVEKWLDTETGQKIPSTHTSRGRFFGARYLDMEALAILAQAIWRYPDKKAKTRRQG